MPAVSGGTDAPGLYGAAGTGMGLAVAGACDLATLGACIAANPHIVGGFAAGGIAAGAWMDAEGAQDHVSKLIQGAIDRATAGPDQHLYALTAQSAGLYPDRLTGGTIHLNAGDVWKYGTSMDPDHRYTAQQMRGLNMEELAHGNYISIRVQEKLQLLGYFTTHGRLPPGNLIWR